VPVKAEASEVSRPPAKARRVKTLAAGQPGYRVLVVDDNADNRTFLVALLEATGFDTRQAIDGGPAVEVFESWRPVLVLMDMRMPGMSGAEAIRRIRAAPGGGAVKLLGVSASSFEEDRNEAVAAGADDFLSKPFREEVLFEKMRALLGVEYDYEAEEVAKNVPGVEDEAAGLTMAVTRLPGPLRERLRQATLRADLDAILALLGQAAEHDARGAARLRDLAERFGYQQLLDLLSLEVEGE
jgi:CheY-like chemotaxis protein